MECLSFFQVGVDGGGEVWMTEHGVRWRVWWRRMGMLLVVGVRRGGGESMV